jgi:hypothetical protein
MSTFAVDLEKVIVYVTTEGKTERIPFKTKRQADRKIVELCKDGYTFDPAFWYERKKRAAHLSVQAHQLCNTLCDKLYNWNPEPERAERLALILAKARTRLARRNLL